MIGEENDHLFLYKRQYPNWESILSRKGKSIKTMSKDAIFVLDTNALLFPYNTGSENIKEIGKTYKKLIKENRLYVPEHVLLEFAKNRSKRISDLDNFIHQSLSKNVEVPKPLQYPILGDMEAYKNLETIREEIKKKTQEYKDCLNKLRSGIEDWNWSDPLTLMYQETLTKDIVIKSDFEEFELISEYKRRIKEEIPPGNKDDKKDANAIGDYVIWQSILDLGKKMRKDIIFVSNDEKNDWLLKGGSSKSISTRFELVDEYYRHTEGHNFVSINFSRFIEEQGLDIEITETFSTDQNRAHSENRIFEILGYIDNILKMFLDDWNEANFEEYTCISDKNLSVAIKDFKGIIYKDHNDSHFQDIIKVELMRLSNILDQINEINNHIILETHRMKRDTSNEILKLFTLCRQFSSAYTTFQIIY